MQVVGNNASRDIILLYHITFVSKMQTEKSYFVAKCDAQRAYFLKMERFGGGSSQNATLFH